MRIKLMHLVASIMHVMHQLLIFGQELHQICARSTHIYIVGTINAPFSICALSHFKHSDDDKFAQIVMMGSQGVNLGTFWFSRAQYCSITLAFIQLMQWHCQFMILRMMLHKSTHRQGREKGRIQRWMRNYLPLEGFDHLLQGVDWDVVQLNKPTVANLLVEQKIT